MAAKLFPLQPKIPNEIIVNGSVVVLYTISESQNFALDVTSVGKRYQGATTHIPKYNLLTLNAPGLNNLYTKVTRNCGSLWKIAR
jgi:hypothetical protein